MISAGMAGVGLVFERSVEYLFQGGIGNGQFSAAEAVRCDLVGVVDEGDGIAGEDEILGHEDVCSLEVAAGVEVVEGANTGLLLQGFQEDGLQKGLEAVDEDVFGGKQSAASRIEIHYHLLADGVGIALAGVDVCQIDQRAWAACLSVTVDDVVIVIPGALGGVLTVVVVERQQRLHVVSGVLLGEGFCGLL